MDNREDARRYSEPEPCFGSAPEALLQGFAGIRECEVHIVSCVHKAVRSPARLADNIYYYSLVVPKWGWLRGAYLGCIRAARKKLREIKPDIVHGQGTERYCALCAVYSGFPNVVTIHGNMRKIAKITAARPLPFLWLAARLERLTLPKAGGVICVSTHTRRQVDLLARTTWVVPNAVDSSFFALSRQPASPRQILCVANILRIKNQTQLIRALDPLANNRNFELVFVGGTGTTDAYTNEFFRLLRERPWCRFQGFAHRSDLQTALCRASLLALPSLEENCPMAVLEAMAAGLPVAAANVGGVPDLIADGTDGLLFDPRMEGSIRAAIAEFLADGTKLAELGAKAKEKALRCFHPQKIAQKHVAIYRQIIANCKAPIASPRGSLQ